MGVQDQEGIKWGQIYPQLLALVTTHHPPYEPFFENSQAWLARPKAGSGFIFLDHYFAYYNIMIDLTENLKESNINMVN